MPSFNIHLAVGKRYYEKNNNINDLELFYRGLLAPDLVKEKGGKAKTHYTGFNDNKDLVKYLREKVLIDEVIKKESIDSDYQKGVFLHLLTDYLFFNDFFSLNYLENISYNNFVKDLYYSYEVSNEWLIKDYNINFFEFSFLEELNENIKNAKKERNIDDNEVRKDILPKDKLNLFIESVSSIDLESYRNKYKK